MTAEPPVLNGSGPKGPELHRLTKAHRLLKRSEFLRAQRAAVRVHHSDFVLLVHRRDPPDGVGARLGLVATRKVGSAVVRNRGKRRVREWFRRCRAGIAADVDVVVILKPGAAAPGRGLSPALDRALEEGLGKKNRGWAAARGAAGGSG